MNVQQITTTNTNFKALHMPPKAEIDKILGLRASNKAEFARERLEKLAKDIDIKLTPVYNEMGNEGFGYFIIKVSKLANSNQPKKTNFITRFLEKRKEQKCQDRVFVYFHDLADKMVAKTEELKNILLK